MADLERARAAEDPVELSVIVPCLNEELNVPELSARILAVFDRGGFVGELMLVDDGSTDDTAGAIRKLEAQHPGRVRGVFHPQNRGIAAGWRSGISAARGKLVCIIDADLQYQPEDILRLRHALYEHSVDIVQGWRSPVGRLKDQRYTLSRGFNTLLNGAFSMSLRDNKSGFLVCAREVMLDLLNYKGSYFMWQSFIMVAAHAKGYSYKEVETLFEKRKQGESFLEKTAIRASVKSFYDLGKAVWEYRVAPPPPDVAANFLKHHPAPERSSGRDPLQSLAWRTYMSAFNRTHFMITRDVEHYYRTLDQTQWLSPADTLALQDEKLRKLIRHCYRNVPFYRSRMQALGLRPQDIRGQADLRRLPIVDRRDVERHLHFDIMSEVHDKDHMLRLSTSGASGQPFVFYADRAALEARWAAALRAAEWTGYRFGDRSARLVDGSRPVPAIELARLKADAALANRALVDIGALDRRAVDRVVAAVRGGNVVMLAGDAEVIELVAREAPPAASRLRGAMTQGQTLGAEGRAIIEQKLATRVFDQYSSAEFGTIAHECEKHDGHHVVAEACIVEILRRDGSPAHPGEIGDVVVTGLDCASMPFVRFRIGDRAAAVDPGAGCGCGRGSPRIGAVGGRPQAMLRGDDGRRVPSSFFFDTLKDYEFAFRRFSIRQVPDEQGGGAGGVVHLRIARAGRYSETVLEEALAIFRRRLGPKTIVSVEVTSDAEFAPEEERNGTHHATS
jgi:phenylacetate-CoA ligase